MNLIQPYTSFNDSNPIAELLDMMERRGPMLWRSHLHRGVKEYANVGRCGNPLTPAMREELRSRVQHEVLACTRPGTLERKRLLERIAREFGVHYQTVIKHTADLRGVPPRRNADCQMASAE